MVLPGWDVVESPVGLVAGLVVWVWLIWWTSRVVVSRADAAETAAGPRALLGWFWLGVSVKAAIIVLWYLALGGHEITPSIGDSGGYDADGWRLAQHLREGRYLFSKPPFMTSYPGFYYWIGAIYAFFGHHPILVSLFDALLSIWIAVMLQQIAHVLFGTRVAVYAFAAALFYPQFISASYFLLKDLATSFVVMLAIWAVYVPRSLERRAVLFIGALALIAVFRAPLAVMVGGLGIAQFALSNTGPSRRQRRVLIAVILVIVFAVVGGSSGSGDKSIFDAGMTTHAGLADDKGFLTGTRLTFSWDGLVAVQNVIVGRPVAFVRYSIDTTIRVFYGPFFLYARGGPSFYPYGPLLSPFRAILECLSGVFTGLLMPMILVGLYECLRVRRRDTVLLIGWLAVGLLSLMLAGALVRWRLPFIVVAFVLAGVGTTRLREMRDIYAAYVVLYVLFMGINATLYEGMILGKILVLALVCALAMRFLVGRREQLIRAVPWVPAQ